MEKQNIIYRYLKIKYNLERVVCRQRVFSLFIYFFPENTPPYT